MAEKSGPKKPKMDRNSPEYKEKLESRVKRRDDYRKKRDKNKLKKNFAERMLGAYGFGEENFKKGGLIKGKLGLFAGAMQQGREESDTFAQPKMETPKVEREKQNPNISVIMEQLNSLIEVVKKIGIITEQQQEQLQQQFSQAARNSEEASMERGSGPNASGLGGPNLNSLNEELGTLIEKSLRPFKKIIDEKVEEQEEEQGPKGFMQRLAENYGVGDEYEKFAKRRAAKAARIKTKPGYKRILGRDGRITYRGPNGRIVSAADAIAEKSSKLAKVGGMVKNAGAGLLNIAKKATSGAGRIASKISGARIASGIGSVTKNISSLLGKGVKSANVAASAARKVGASTIKRIAGPIIKKALGSTALKSIPIIGGAVGGLFAAKKLLEGDPVGAGLEAASGLGGPITAIPALVASASRDTYSSVFDVQPEQDPMFGIRMKLITGVIGGLVTAYFASRIEKKPTPTKDNVDKISIPPKPAQKTAGQTATGMPAIPNAPAPSPAKSTSPSTPTSTPTPNSTSPSSTSSSATKKSTSESKKQVAASNDKNDAVKKESSKAQSMVNNAPNTGADISKMTAEVEAAANQPNVIDLGSKRPLPSSAPPSKSGVSGAGNVPDPRYYGMGEVFTQIYFNPNPITLT